MTTKKPSYEIIRALYIQWLKGATLRQLAKQYPVSVNHSTICNWFNSTFGKGASNPRELSLLRSLLEDNPGCTEVEEWVLANIHTRSGHSIHRSKHSISQLSRFQVVREPKLMEYIAPTGNNPWDTLERPTLEFLRLPLYRVLIDAIAIGLEDLTRE